MKILIVDDDPIITTTISSNLEKWGYAVVIANSAEQAWSLMQQVNPPKIAIIDWILPNGMSGIELCKLVKAKNQQDYCYTIMLTGRMGTDDVIIGLESGADDYVIKPVDAGELRARILAGKRIIDKFEYLQSRLISGKNIEAVNIDKSQSFSVPKILIAEDDPVSREVLKENLNQWGFSVIITTNGQEALDAFYNYQGPILGIIDWMMPNISGLDVCRQIKKKSEDGCSYLILLTAKTQRTDITEGLESGADDYLCKPFHAAELRARINIGIRTLSANRHLKAIVANNSEGIVTIAGDGIIDSFNHAAEQMFNYQTQEVIGQNISSLISIESQEKYKYYLENSLSKIFNQKNKPIELIGVKKNQIHFPLELNLACMGYDGNQRFVGIIRDITEQKYHQKQLISAKESAEKANLAKSQFLSSMSHELRTPLNAILGFAQLLGTDPDYPLAQDQKESLDCILQGGHHLLGLINEVLDLARIESGHVSLNIEDVNIDEVTNESISLISQLATANETEIFQSTKTELNQVKADSERLRQIIINLLSNAIKYNSRPGKIFVEKSVTQDAFLRITFRDTGKGIADDKKSQLFKPFSRLGAEITDIEGTGIGLVITKTLIEEMHGNIGFKSELGKGSSFWIEIPLSDSKQI